MRDPDGQLAKRCGRGDMAAFETLYRRYAPRVWRYGWFRTRSRDTAADVVQETFLRIARSAGNFKGRSRFSTYLFAVARSVCIDLGRRERREREGLAVPAVLKLVHEDGAETASATSTDAREAVREAIARLCGGQRDAVVLCDLFGMRIKEAAATLEWTESRVKVTLFRARRKLRELLQDRVANGDDESRMTSCE